MLLLSILFFFLTNAYGYDRLPGIDDIVVGYDAVKMVPLNKRNSEYRLFNLHEDNATTFQIKIFDQTYTYTTPQSVQVTDVSVRKEDPCEIIAYTFESFFQHYFQSISSDVELGAPYGINTTVEYSEILKQIQKAMTKHKKAVGISTTWWGSYLVQLAPSFLSELHPTFIQSIDLLATKGSNPTTEDHQSYYNQFLRTYGTHYTSEIIVGGTAHLYTIIEPNFYEESLYDETTAQVGLMFQYEKYLGKFGYETSSVWASMAETFKKNTATLSVFQPSIITQENKSNWETWQKTVGEQPVVINRTLISIHKLIENKHVVRDHLRKTIEFYLRTGSMPTLAQLNGGKTTRLSLVSPKPVGLIEGLDVVGCGYNALSMETRLCILNQSDFSENEQWSDPFNKTLSYSLPNGWFAVNTPESLTLDGSFLVTSVDDYFRSTTTVTTTETVQERSFWFGRYRRTEKTVKEVYRRFYQDYYNLLLRIKQIGWYTLSVSTFPYPKLNSVAQTAFNDLPRSFDIKDLKIWQNFFDHYGTHIVVSSIMGGQIQSEIWYEKCLTYEKTQEWIDEQVKYYWLWFLFRPHIDNRNEHREKTDKYFTQHSIISSKLIGGDLMEASNWEQWVSTVTSKPRPVSYRLLPLDQLLPESEQQNALKLAIDYVLKQAGKEDQTYISQLEGIRPPPKRDCSPRVTRTKRNTQVTLEQARQEGLCPYSGYGGKECFGEKMQGRSLVAENTPKMPVGVGMTIDITTGKLLLPALEYTYLRNNYWNDIVTNVTYQIPRGVTRIPISATDNDPIIRVFMTATELSNEWKYEKLRGSWLGGEFGHSKSLMDLYTKFFSKNQAVAITQKPTVLYRLRVENLKLNKYAAKAIEALPSKYNEALYSSFLNAWGTHIVQQSLIGGLHEQQVLFKDCVFSFNGAITSDNLTDYLKQDLLEQTLGNSFYANRRKISVNNWLGGRPYEQNETRWRETLADNPALLKIEEYIAWSDIPGIEPGVRANLKKLIDARTAAADKIRMDEENKVMEQRFNGTYMAREGLVGLVNNGKCEMIATTFGSVKDCSEGCPTSVLVKEGNGFFDGHQLWYVRDETTGFIRARINAQTITEGPKVNAGCSSISTPTKSTTSAHICVSCELVDTFPNQCICVCPQYSSSTAP